MAMIIMAIRSGSLAGRPSNWGGQVEKRNRVHGCKDRQWGGESALQKAARPSVMSNMQMTRRAAKAAVSASSGRGGAGGAEAEGATAGGSRAGEARVG